MRRRWVLQFEHVLWLGRAAHKQLSAPASREVRTNVEVDVWLLFRDNSVHPYTYMHETLAVQALILLAAETSFETFIGS